MHRLGSFCAGLAITVCLCPQLFAADAAPGTTRAATHVVPPDVALRKFSVLPGLKVDLFAAEPDVRNPVALSIDEHGRVFVVESDRRRSSVFDIRGHKEWLNADFSFRTVNERAEFLKSEVVPEKTGNIERLTKGGRGDFKDFNGDGIIDWRDLEVQSERIRLLEDADGDGKSDRATVFADGFTNIVAGVAAGVLAQGGDVYFACIPDLWKFPNYRSRMPNASTRATTQPLSNLLSGFGVHIAFGGHDMHGLILAPDGRLYWSIADRGTDTNLFAKIKNPIPGLTPELLADSGCIFRANRDGSDFEVVAWGLRNPQELAFDEFGNLFTADNNGDGGDKARWHYVVEGADFGWRIGWQWMDARAYQPKMGPWNGERLWHLAESNTASYLLPPLAHIGHGPAGLAYNPGTGLPSQFDGHYFLCDFPGHVLTWTNIPDGASFRAGPVRNFFGDLGPTDVAFHPDGGVLVTDWFKSFDKSDKGRLYRIHDPATDRSAVVQETKHLLAEGMSKRSANELVELLGHRDMRVRLEAQFALVDSSNMGRLSALALHSANRMVRWHAIAAISQIVQTNPLTEFVRELEAMLPLLRDKDAEIRAAAARLMGKGRLLAAQGRLGEMFSDESPRARMQAIFAYRDLFAGFRGGGGHRHRLGLLDSIKQRANLLLGSGYFDVNGPSLGWPVNQLVTMLSGDPVSDRYVQHAATVLLAEIGRTSGTAFTPNMTGRASNPSPAVRNSILLAYRRLGDPTIATFLSDRDPRLVLEAARAINDVPIVAAYPQLASLIGPDGGSATNRHETTATTELEFFALRRALNANFRLGLPANALAMAAFAARGDVAEPLRVEALELLALWPNPPARDHFMGLYRPLPPRDSKPASDALRPVIATLLGDAPKEVKLAAFHAADALGLHSVDLAQLTGDTAQPPELRAEALRALARRDDERLVAVLKVAAEDAAELVRLEAKRLQGGAGDVTGLVKQVESGGVAGRQAALATLGTLDGAEADVAIGRQLEALLGGTLVRELQLDVLEAAAQRPGLKGRLDEWTSRLSKDDPLAVYRPALFGGNAVDGRRTFVENQQVACFRCHKINGEGGDVGPDLTGVVAKRGREYVLESIVLPNRQIAAGFENVLITMKDGAEYAGLVKSETDAELVLNSPEDGLMTLTKADLRSRQRGLSAMPEDLIANLSRRDLRDLIEFLAATP